MTILLRALPALLLLAGSLDAQNESASEEALKEEAARLPVLREALRRTALILVQNGQKWIPIGSGGVISPEGHVVTCAHVVEGGRQAFPSAEFAVVLSDGKLHEAKRLGKNSNNDIALLKIEGEKLPCFDLADVRPAKDESILALGYPAGNVGMSQDFRDGTLPHASVALGRVLDPNRRFVIPSEHGWKFYPDCIESDTPIFMGNSGGPLVDLQGRLVGLNAAISSAGKSYTLSAASILSALDEMKKGRDVEGKRVEDGMKGEDYGRILGDILGWSDPSGGEREYLRPGFARMAEARKSGVLRITRGRDTVGHATVLDADGNLVAASAALDRKSAWAKALEAIGEQLKKDKDLWSLWEDARKLLGLEEGVEVRLPSGKRVKAEVVRRSEKLGVVHLKIDPSGEKLVPIPEAEAVGMEPGRWVAVLGGGALPIAVGLLSAPKHTIASGMRIPMSFQDYIDAWANDEVKPREFVDIILFDARLAPRELGAPLCDGRGRMIGVAIFHPSRGTTYAVPIGDLRKEFGVK